MKIVIGLVVGLVVLVLVTGGIEWLSHTYLFPPPPGLDITNPADQARIMAAMPVGGWAMVAVAWFLGAFAGAWAANRIARSAMPGWIIALLTVAFGVYTMMTIPGHPTWMWAAGIALPLLAGWLAQRSARVVV